MEMEYLTYWVTLVQWLNIFLQGIQEFDIVFSFIGVICDTCVELPPLLQDMMMTSLHAHSPTHL